MFCGKFREKCLGCREVGFRFEGLGCGAQGLRIKGLGIKWLKILDIAMQQELHILQPLCHLQLQFTFLSLHFSYRLSLHAHCQLSGFPQDHLVHSYQDILKWTSPCCLSSNIPQHEASLAPSTHPPCPHSIRSAAACRCHTVLCKCLHIPAHGLHKKGMGKYN